MTERLIISPPFYITESSSECGYCHGKKLDKEKHSLESWYQYYQDAKHDVKFTNCTLGFQTESMSVEMYDKWCNMGYRRSGNFLYKTDILRNCCRIYTIRTTSSEANLSKDLKTTIKRYIKTINGDNAKNNQVKKGGNVGVDYLKELVLAENGSHSFRTVFEPATFTKEKYKLFVKYQENVHHDYKNSEKSFNNFLCKSPFSEETIKGTQEEWDQLNNWRNIDKTEKLKRLGPAHECYYYNETLIAIAVLDFLPSGLSSVYFIWDPDYHKWSLGKISALRELCISEKTDMKYYYMGYYIEDCPKMVYKAKYGGEILDLDRHQYMPLVDLKNSVNLTRFFVTNNDIGNSAIEEPFLNDKLRMQATVRKWDSNTNNIAELLYGSKGTAYRNSNLCAEKLSKLGIPFGEDSETDLYNLRNRPYSLDHVKEIPHVFPGLLPLSEVLTMVQENSFDVLNFRLIFYDMNLGGIRPMRSFQDESPEVKKLVCDTVRCIGLENVFDSLIIIQ